MPEKEVRLIDANALRKDISETLIFSGRSDHASAELRGANKVINRIEAAPSIDPESLRPHGKWLETVEELGWQEVRCYKCSVCGESWILDEEWSIESIMESHNYCPNCGAKMEG